MVVRLRIHGRVQGVWYRGWLVDEAERAGIDGWVRNRGDGTVEAVLAGEPGALRELIRRCHRGPPMARVTRIDEAEEKSVPGRGFTQRPSV